MILKLGILSLILFHLTIHSVECKKESSKDGTSPAKGLMIHSKECSEKRLQKMDKLLNSILPYGPHRKDLPTNQQTLKPWCREALGIIGEFERFIRQCFRKDARDLALISLYSSKQLVRRYCTKRRSKATVQLLASADCLNKHVFIQQPCLNPMINNTLSIIEMKNTKLKVPHLCCLYFSTYQCMDRFLDSVECIQPHRQVLFDMLNSSMEQMTDVACGEYQQGSNKCDSLSKLPPPNPKKHSNSYIMIMVEMLNSMDTL